MNVHHLIEHFYLPPFLTSFMCAFLTISLSTLHENKKRDQEFSLFSKKMQKHLLTKAAVCATLNA
jgi:hypothetical protein